MKFKEGKIVEIFYVNKGKEKTPVIIRYPKKTDLREIWKFYNKVIKETEGLSRVSPVTLGDEKKWIDDVLKSIKRDDKCQILAEANQNIVGSVGIHRLLEERRKHVGGFGIAILQEYAGLGLGKKLMEKIEEDAMKMNLRIIELHVHGKNKIAQNLYKKMGFKIAGKTPKAVKIRGGYDDDVLMYKVLKK